MKFLVATAFLAILSSLGAALFFMMRGGKSIGDTQAPKPQGHMVKALAFRVGFSIVLFVCVLVAWRLGYIQPTGIPGH
jgi:Protein of unknown function (DUF2909)